MNGLGTLTEGECTEKAAIRCIINALVGLAYKHASMQGTKHCMLAAASAGQGDAVAWWRQGFNDEITRCMRVAATPALAYQRAAARPRQASAPDPISSASSQPWAMIGWCLCVLG